MEESQKKLQEEMQKEKPKTKGEISINEMKKEEKIKVFRNQEIYKGKDPWTDPLFKPEKASLCPYDKKGWILPKQAIEDDIKNFKNFKWARVEDIFDSKDYFPTCLKTIAESTPNGLKVMELEEIIKTL